MKVRAILCDRCGAPADVCHTRTLELPEPAAGEVIVRIRFAPINPADINMIEGSYATKPKLPMVPGGEGVGVVEHLGPGVEGLREGDHVLIPAGIGSWREALVVSAEDLFPVPVDGPIEQMAMLRVNPPTAYRMLHDFVSLSSGEWVLQNAANSGVGRSVIQIAKSKGWKTVNVVRRAELVKELLDAGGDVVLVESADLPKQIAEVVKAPIRLALNAVGGESALKLASSLARSGTLVTYGAMSRQPVRVPNGLLIFNDIRFRGFWVTRWYRESTPEMRTEMFSDLLALLRDGRLFTPIDRTFGLDEASTALSRAGDGGRRGKVLFQMAL